MDSRVVQTWQQVRDECRRDYVDLCTVPGWLPDALRQSQECIPLSMQIVDSLLSDPEIIVGQFRDRVFEPWTLSASEAYDRIQGEWQALDRLPNISEICWFTENTFHLTNR